jgi:hypothetical protein
MMGELLELKMERDCAEAEKKAVEAKEEEV